MFVARDAKGHLVNALEDELNRQTYTCLACGGGLRLRKGKVVRTHFAHKSLKDCSYYFENESPEHLGNKEALYHWAKKDSTVALEFPIAEIQQIADVLVNGKLALEVQCSPLPQKMLRARSQGYRSLGYQVLWLLGTKLWLKDRLTNLQRDFLYFSQNLGFYVWEIDQKKQVLRLKYLLHQDLRARLHYQVKEFPFGKGKLLDILRSPYQKQGIATLTVKQDPSICYYIRQQLYYQNPYWMNKQAQAYQQGQNILNYELKDWYPQIRPIEKADFCQIDQNLSAYYKEFLAFYHKHPQNNKQNLYPPAFYHQYFSKNMVK